MRETERGRDNETKRQRGRKRGERQRQISWLLKDLPLSDQGLRNGLTAQIWTENIPFRSLVSLLGSTLLCITAATRHCAHCRTQKWECAADTEMQCLPGDSGEIQRSQHWETLEETLNLCDL